MSTKAKPKTKARPRGQSDLMTAVELATALGYADTRALYRHVSNRLIPPPHSQIGTRHTLWRRDHYEHFLKTGEWPKEAWRNLR